MLGKRNGCEGPKPPFGGSPRQALGVVASMPDRAKQGGVSEESSSVGTPAMVELDVLFRNEQHALVRFFTRYRASPEDARDLVQETFLRLARLDPNRSGSILRPAEYLRQIARNLLKDRAKAARRHAADAHQNADDVDLAGVDELGRLEARDSLARLEAAMATLKPRTREIFMAHRLEGLSYAEIAARTGLTVWGVEKQIGRAIDHLRRKMGRP